MFQFFKHFTDTTDMKNVLTVQYSNKCMEMILLTKLKINNSRYSTSRYAFELQIFGLLSTQLKIYMLQLQLVFR